MTRVATLVLAMLTLAACSTEPSPGDSRPSQPGSTAATTSTPPAASAASSSTTTTGSPPVHAVTGVALSATGRPLAERVVTLRENRGLAKDVFGLFVAALSLGTSCVAGADPCRASGEASTVTDEAGRFSFDPSSVQSARGNSRGVVLQFGDARTEGSLALQLNPELGGDLGKLSLWDPAMQAREEGSTGVALSWRGPPGANQRTVLHGALTDGTPTAQGGDRALVSFSPHGPTATVIIDRRALEDRKAVTTLAAGFSRDRAGQRSRVDWTAPIRGLGSAGAGPPLSRGAACSAVGIALEACNATDGDLTSPLVTLARAGCTHIPCPESTVSAVIVDLGREAAVGTIAVRNATDVVIEVSRDGRTWVPAKRSSVTAIWPATLASGDGEVARFIRARPGPMGLLNPSEISVWPPEPPPPIVEIDAAGEGVPGLTIEADDDREGSDQSGVAVRLLAIVVFVIVVAAAGFMLGRRSQRRRP